MIVRTQDLGLSSLLPCGLGVSLWAGWSRDCASGLQLEKIAGAVCGHFMDGDYLPCAEVEACHLQELTVKEGSDWTLSLGELCLARGTKLNLESLGEIPALCPQSP